MHLTQDFTFVTLHNYPNWEWTPYTRMTSQSWTTVPLHFLHDLLPYSIPWPVASLTPECLPWHNQSSLPLKSFPDHLTNTLSLDVASAFSCDDYVMLSLLSVSKPPFLQGVSQSIPKSPFLHPCDSLPQPFQNCICKNKLSPLLYFSDCLEHCC